MGSEVQKHVCRGISVYSSGATGPRSRPADGAGGSDGRDEKPLAVKSDGRVAGWRPRVQGPEAAGREGAGPAVPGRGAPGKLPSARAPS